MPFFLWSQTIPSVFNLVDSGFVTSVKSQQGGTCWTHGTAAAIESNLLINGNWANNGETGEPNLAEYHLDWWNGFNEYYNADLDNPYNNNEGLEVHMGGDYLVATAYFSRGDGFVRDQDGQSYDIPPEYSDPTFHYYYPRDAEWFTIGDNLEGIDTIKKMIMQYGAVATCMCYDDDFIDDNYNHYQPPSSNYLPNHSIAIVGWDDNHTVPAAPAPGAWLCKNSWGTNWGYNGYFWISYYDKWACREPFMGAVSFHNTEPLQYDLIYYHDYHGWRDTKTDITEAMNKFHSRENIWLKSVSFFTASDSVEYTVKIFKKFTDSIPNYTLSKKSGIIRHRGFHTVDLDLPVLLHNGMDFYVYLYLSKGGQPYDRTSTISVLMGDTTLKKGLKEAVLVRSKASPDESFYKDSTGWHDFYFYNDPSGYQHTGNFTIKALAKNYQPQNLGAVFHIFKDNRPVKNARITFNNQTIETDTDGCAIFTNIPPNTENIDFHLQFDEYDTSATFSIADTVLIKDFYFGTTQVTQNQNIIIYPNIVKDKFFVKNAKNSKLLIFDLSGKILQQTNIISDNQQVTANELHNGTYLVKIINKKGSVTKKIVVIH